MPEAKNTVIFPLFDVIRQIIFVPENPDFQCFTIKIIYKRKDLEKII